jgi:hypothetical protein
MVRLWHDITNLKKSTILYLNSSFNCIKSNSITITKTGNGRDYTSAPTVTIRPAKGDMGSGAAATIAAPVSGVLVEH